MTVTLTTSSSATVINLQIPQSVGWKEDRNTANFHFWNNYDEVKDISMNIEALVISGLSEKSISGSIDAFPYTFPITFGSTSGSANAMQVLNSMIDEGDEITLAGLPINMLNGTYYVRNFTYNISFNTPDYFEYNFTLEKS